MPEKADPAAGGKVPSIRSILPAVLFEDDPPPVTPTAPASFNTTAPKPTAAATTGMLPAKLPKPPLVPPVPPGSSPTPAPRLEDLPVHLVARDPHCVFAHWEVPAAASELFARMAGERRLRLRVRSAADPGIEASHTVFAPGTRSVFIPVPLPGHAYRAELVYLPEDGEWVVAGRSGAAATPPAEAPRVAPADFVAVARLPSGGPTAPAPATAPVVSAPAYAEPPRSGTTDAAPASPVKPVVVDRGPVSAPPLPANGSRGEPALPAKGAVADGLPVTRTTLPEPDAAVAGAVQPWTAAQAAVIRTAMGLSPDEPVWEAGSAALVGLQGPGGPALAPSSRPALPASPSSEWGGGAASGGPGLPASSENPTASPTPRAFWFNVNAELIVYGATQPGATVRLDGIPLRLRPDGTFSLRFALPDGGYRLAFEAVSADASDRRAARLRFVRQTRTSGRVDAHPQDVRLFAPPADTPRS
ncbi:MAG: DUF4912 domain-containing protein [Verrucomicrobiales bacterium]|nr:DUF4912 domain-containing protein [Verrucomicrobiales bacterium]MCP5528530.1 DUF4912 domain-containing protein [Verrucomicrobiales bacterium]